MKYIVRLNQRAYNPITSKVDPRRVWEVEQCATKDSEKVIWHCAEVLIDGVPFRTFFVLPNPGDKPFEASYEGIVVRGQDDAIEIKEGRHDVFS